MRGKTARIDWKNDTDELKRLHRRETNPQIKPRLHLLWLVREGKQIKEAAALLGVHLRTSRRWIAWYRDGGLALVGQKKGGGRGAPSRLTPEQQQTLLDYLAEQGSATAQEVCQWVVEQFGVVYSVKGMYGLLARLKVKKKVPRPMNAKADEETQQAYKKRD